MSAEGGSVLGEGTNGGGSWTAIFASYWAQVIWVIVGFILILFIGRWIFQQCEHWLARRSGIQEDGLVKRLIEAPKPFLITGLIFVLLGVLILNSDAASTTIGIKLAGLLVTELGFAFFIAFILHVTIEFHAKVEHDRHISRGLLSYVYGVALDDAMFRATEKAVFESRFYRRNLQIELEFLQHKENKFLIKHTLEYEIQNIGDTTAVYDIASFVEKPSDEIGSAVKWSKDIGLYRIKISGKNLDATELKKAKEVAQYDPDYIISSHPLELSPGEKKRIQCILFFEKCDRDSELWRSIYLADGMVLIVRWPEAWKMGFRADAVHPKGKFEQKDIEKGRLEARIMEPIFPHNGFFLWWGSGVITGVST